MKRRLTALAVGACCASSWLPPGPAEACSPRPPDWVSFAEVLPGKGSRDVAVDAPLVLRFNQFPSQGAAVPKTDLPQTAEDYANLLKIEVTDLSSGQTIAGTRGSLGWNGSVTTFQPAAPLAANTRFQVVARVTNVYLRPADGQGETELSAEFTTGSALLRPLTSATPSTGSIERYTAPVLEATACGSLVESPTATQSALRTRLRLPAVTGGFAPATYFVRTMVTRDVPYDFAVDPGAAAAVAWDQRFVAAGDSPELLFRMEDAIPLAVTQICHVSQFQDAAGKKLVTAPLCVPALHPASADANFWGGQPLIGCNLAGNGEAAAPLVLVIAWASFAGFLILRRARRRDL
jgi:hypothetical protein